jgi:hypothetical protein
LDSVGYSFPMLRRVCWPALEECYELYTIEYNVLEILIIFKIVFGVLARALLVAKGSSASHCNEIKFHSPKFKRN